MIVQSFDRPPTVEDRTGLRGNEEGTMKRLCITAAAMSALIVGASAARADDALQTLEGMHMTAPMDWPTIPQDRAKGGRRQANSEGEDQTAARVPHRALRPCSRCAPHGGRPAGCCDLRRNPQEQDLGGDRSLAHAAPRAASRSRNSRRVCRSDCRTAPASRRMASCMSSSRTGSCNMRRPSSSMRVRTSRLASSFRRAS